MKTIEIYCENTKETKAYPLGTTLEEIKDDLQIKLKNPICGALVNHKVKELSFAVVKSKRIQFIDYSHIDGRRLYTRSLLFLLYVAVRETFPQVKLRIMNGISQGYYCEFVGLEREITESDIFELKSEMRSWVERDLPFVKKEFQQKRLSTFWCSKAWRKKPGYSSSRERCSLTCILSMA